MIKRDPNVSVQCDHRLLEQDILSKITTDDLYTCFEFV